MKNQTLKPQVDRSKTMPIATLFVTALLIIIAGVALGVTSIVGDISFPVMNIQVHGAVWGVVIMFLGVRYLLSVQRLKAEVYQSISRFSWSNFKTEKVQKARPTHK